MTISIITSSINTVGEVVSHLTPEDARNLKQTCKGFYQLFSSNVPFIKQIVMGGNWEMLILSSAKLKGNEELKTIVFELNKFNPTTNLGLFEIDFFKKDKDATLIAVSQNGWAE